MSGLPDAVKCRLLSGGIVEFSWHGGNYLIQQEDNKGWNYLSLWRTSPDYVCLARTFYDIMDGLSEDTILDFFSLPCLDGRSVQDILEESLREGTARQDWLSPYGWIR